MIKVYFFIFFFVQIPYIKGSSSEQLNTSGGYRQSPVEIISRKTIPVCNAKVLKWNNYKYEAFIGELVKGNSTVKLRSSWDGNPPFLSGGPLTENYILSEIHWHWGNQNNYGSEHVIDGKLFPIEMHIVTHSHAYNNLSEAIQSNDTNAIAAVAYLFTIHERSSPGFATLASALSKLSTSTVFESIFEYSLLGQKYIPSFYNYCGSLTTPPYSEKIIWIISKNLLRISSEQLKQFRLLENNGVTLSNNFRSPQPLNNRKIYSYGLCFK